MLLWPRTRIFGLAWSTAFHLCNAWLFQIGIFPWFMLAATWILFPPAWPRLGRWLSLAQSIRPQLAPLAPLSSLQRLTVALLAAYLSWQIAMPLRHFLYPGNVHWTEEGHRFSWHMKLRSKRGTARFFATEPSRGVSWEVDPRLFLTPRQLHNMSTRPDMLLQFAHHVARELRLQGKGDVEVRGRVLVSLNGRPPQPILDPAIDLAAEPRTLWPASWILPLNEDSVPSFALGAR
jgi:hypothetical protein